MTKVIHSDFLTIEKNQAWDLMPSFVPAWVLYFRMIQKALNLYSIEQEYEKKLIIKIGRKGCYIIKQLVLLSLQDK